MITREDFLYLYALPLCRAGRHSSYMGRSVPECSATKSLHLSYLRSNLVVWETWSSCCTPARSPSVCHSHSVG